MASTKVISRLSSRLQPVAAFKLNKGSLAPQFPSLNSCLPPSPINVSAANLSRLSRLPVELSCVVSMLPLHSAIASARLISSLSVDSQTWTLVPQGRFLL
ncbi:hypothetical protein LINGRAHAP2_LOCUS3116 [Linum grandiflorum]